MLPRSLLRLVAIAATSLSLAGCGRTETYRYKLTLAVDTPEGVKRGSSVGEVLFYDVRIPARGTMHQLCGEALYLDLGPGARPMIALLTGRLHSKYGKEQGWTYDAGPEIRFLSRLYGETPSIDYMDDVPRIARTRGPRRITPADLPDLVTFADINDPSSVIVVNPNDLQATLGPNIAWNEITLESTNEPVTTGIKTKLPWLPAYHGKMLDGDTVSYFDARKTLANTLSTADFRYPGDPKDPKESKWSVVRIAEGFIRLLIFSMRHG
jgi:hypothetical protein